jgi:hypothetical protein
MRCWASWMLPVKVKCAYDRCPLHALLGFVAATCLVPRVTGRQCSFRKTAMPNTMTFAASYAAMSLPEVYLCRLHRQFQ